MKRPRTPDAKRRSNSTNNLFAKLGTVSFGVFLLALDSLPSAAQLISPTIQNVSVIQGTNSRTLRMQIPTQAGVNYTAQFRNQLEFGLWFPFTNFVGSGPSDIFSNNVTSISRRFFRVVADPRPWIRGDPLSRDPYDGETVQLDVVATGLLPLT